jgi:hypothetical protein
MPYTTSRATIVNWHILEIRIAGSPSGRDWDRTSYLSMSTRCLKPNLLRLFGFLKTLSCFSRSVHGVVAMPCRFSGNHSGNVGPSRTTDQATLDGIKELIERTAALRPEQQR